MTSIRNGFARIDVQIWLLMLYIAMIVIEWSQYAVRETVLILPLLVGAFSLWIYRKELQQVDFNIVKRGTFWLPVYQSLIIGIIIQALGIVIVRYVIGIDKPEIGFALPIALPLISVLISSPLEEVIFRRMMFGGLDRRFGFWPAALISSALFAVMHYNYSAWFGYLLLGFVWCYFYKKTGNFLVPVASHMAFNFLVYFTQSFYAL